MTTKEIVDIFVYIMQGGSLLYVCFILFKQSRVTNKAKGKLDKIVIERETREVEKKAIQIMNDYHNLLAEFIKSESSYNYHPQNQLLIAKQLTELSTFVRSCVYAHLLDEEINKK